MTDDIVARLRHATGEAHERLETRLDIIRRVCRPGERRAIVERFWGLHEGAERALAPMLDDVDGLDLPARRRAGLIEADLADLGRNEREPIPVCPVEHAKSRAEALGFFYVLEGSTLGGKVIRRELAALGQDTTGLSFLDPYGADSGDRWRSFLAVLRRECPSGQDDLADETVRGAVSAFKHAEGWLCSVTVTA
jgi:heme oxygenase